MKSAIERMEEGVEMMIWIVDFQNYYTTVDTTGTELLLKAINVLQNHFPERLYLCYAVNTPWWFNALWYFLSPFISDTTKNKIMWLNGTFEENKEKFLINMTEDNLPSKYGGKIQVTNLMKEFWDTIELKEDCSIIDNTKEKNPEGLESSSSIEEEKKTLKEEELKKQTESTGWFW
jgi:hypothetical protein